MKILAIDKHLSGATPEKIKMLLKKEVQHSWELQKQEIIREIYFRTDNAGVVLILECKSIDEAQKVLSEFPLVKAGLIEFECMSLGCFKPFELLFGK